MARMASGTISLSVVSGVMCGLVAVFDVKKRITLGRVRANKFQIKSDTVSSKHAIVAFVDGRWCITDCDSSNGTSVNGISVTPGTPVELKDKDIIVVGVGSDNVVRVDIEMAGRIEVHVQKDVHVQKSAQSTLTVKGWSEKEIEALTTESEALVQAALKELADTADQIKRDVCSKADVN